MVARDCGLHTWDLVDGEMKEITSTLLQKSGVTSPWASVEVQVNSTRCVYSGDTFSRMIKSEASTAYGEHRSITLSEQPFAFAGDLVFTAVQTTIGTWGIEVHRIWGNQVILLLLLLSDFSATAGHMHCNSAPKLLLLALRERSALQQQVQALPEVLERMQPAPLLVVEGLLLDL